MKKETLSFEELNNLQLKTDRDSILLKAKDKEIGNFNDFTSKEKYLEVVELIKQYIPAIPHEKIATQNNTLISSTNQKLEHQQINP